MAHFIPFHKTDVANYVTELYFKVIIKLYGVPKTIVSDENPNSYPTFGGV